MKHSTIEYDWLTIEEAAEYTRFHPDTLRDLCRRGDLQAVKVGGSWRTTKQWCNEYLMGGAA